MHGLFLDIKAQPGTIRFIIRPSLKFNQVQLSSVFLYSRCRRDIPHLNVTPLPPDVLRTISAVQ